MKASSNIKLWVGVIFILTALLLSVTLFTLTKQDDIGKTPQVENSNTSAAMPIIDLSGIDRKKQVFLEKAIAKTRSMDPLERSRGFEVISVHSGDAGTLAAIRNLRVISREKKADGQKENAGLSSPTPLDVASMAVMRAGRKAIPVILSEMKNESDPGCLHDLAKIVVRLIGPKTGEKSLPRLEVELKDHPDALLAIKKVMAELKRA